VCLQLWSRAESGLALLVHGILVSLCAHDNMKQRFSAISERAILFAGGGS